MKDNLRSIKPVFPWMHWKEDSLPLDYHGCPSPPNPIKSESSEMGLRHFQVVKVLMKSQFTAKVDHWTLRR